MSKQPTVGPPPRPPRASRTGLALRAVGIIAGVYLAIEYLLAKRYAFCALAVLVVLALLSSALRELGNAHRKA